MSDLENRIAALSPAKRALLERRLQEKTGRFEAEPIKQRPEGVHPPASLTQQRLWLIDQLNPGSTAYNMTRAINIEGDLDVSVLKRVLSEIVLRHETLRTTFATENGTLIQTIAAPGAAMLSEIDLTALPDSKKEAQTASAINEEAARSFNLEKGPLFRASLLKLDAKRHVLVLSLHHIVSDGWSMGILYAELFAIYDSFINGRSSPLAPLPIQYGDFALWQRQRLRGDLLVRELNYWREALRELPTLDLPADHPRPPIQTFSGKITRFQVPGNIVQQLKSISREEGATLFMTLLGAFQVLLRRYTGQDDIVVGSPIAGRTRLEMEGLIGFFVNMLVLRTDLSGNPTFRELLKRVQNVAHGAYAHQDIPFEKLVEELNPRRDPSRNPLFQVVLALQNTPRQSTALTGLTTTPINIQQMPCRFDLEVHFFESEESLNSLIVYNSSLFEEQTIDRMMQHFQVLLDGIAADADRKISDLPLLTPPELQQQTVDWNNTATAYPRDACVPWIFEHRVKEIPTAVAVQYGKHRITYRQLNDRSNQLAHYLKSRGVGPDVLVGVCIERSIDMIVALLAVLKAGGAYVPLDPSYPRERLAFMLKDADVPVLLTHERLRSEFDQIKTSVVCVDTHRFDEMPRDNPDCMATAANLAYVMYTSGSTGRPKGAAIPHRAIVRLVVNTNYIDFRSADRVGQASNAAFDAATFEIWGALLNGATLIGIPQDVLLSPKQFAKTIRDERITTLFLTTALFNEIANETPDAFQPLRYLLVGGQACDAKWVRRVLQHGPPQHLLNVYGPTESTTFATWHAVTKVDESATTVPIGRPVSNTETYILDRDLLPVPVGVTGELYIGGDGLARGYWNRPELTAEKFIRSPFNNDPSARLYRTGDYARHRPDGGIEFIGRIDNQVKIRGFRIELQEIEAALSQYPTVNHTAVVAVPVEGAEKRLIAYFVSSGATKPSPDSLREFLRRKLPDYMVPSVFIALESLPLTSNGKIDYASLPAPGLASQERQVANAEPETSIQAGLAEIWREVLRIDRVGIHDDFFGLGGHSLLAIQLIARIEKRFGKSLTAAALFQAPTISQLAKVLHEGTPEHASAPLLPLQPEGSRTPFFWILGELSNAQLPAYLGPDQPVFGLEHQALDGSRARYTKIPDIARYYLNELRRVRPHGPYFLGGYCFGAVVAFEIAQQLKKEGEQVSLIFMLDPPWVRRKFGKPASAKDQIKRHWRELTKRRFREKLKYLLPRFTNRLSTSTDWFKEPFVRLCWKGFLRFGCRVPVSVRSAYILDIYARALKSYRPQPYSGSVAIFKAQHGQYIDEWNWKTLIAGELEIYEHSAQHLDLTKEPQLRHWAVRLKALLDRAEEKADRRLRACKVKLPFPSGIE